MMEQARAGARRGAASIAAASQMSPRLAVWQQHGRASLCLPASVCGCCLGRGGSACHQPRRGAPRGRAARRRARGEARQATGAVARKAQPSRKEGECDVQMRSSGPDEKTVWPLALAQKLSSTPSSTSALSAATTSCAYGCPRRTPRPVEPELPRARHLGGSPAAAPAASVVSQPASAQNVASQSHKWTSPSAAVPRAAGGSAPPATKPGARTPPSQLV